MGIYGPRTIYCIALKDAPGCHEFLLQDDGKWLHVKETTEIGEYPLTNHYSVAEELFYNACYEAYAGAIVWLLLILLKIPHRFFSTL